MLKRQKTFNVGSAITLVYVVSSFSSILLYYKHLDVFEKPISLGIIPTFLYCFLLAFAILPFYKLQTDKIVKIKPVDEKKFSWVAWFFIIVSFLCLIVSWDKVIEALTGDMLAIRNEFYASADEEIRGGQAWYQYLLGLVPVFSPVMVAMFFYSIIYLKKKLWFNLLLLLASVVTVVVSTTNAARTQVIYWVLTFYLVYCFFRPQITSKIKRRFIIFLSPILVAFAFYFVAVTVARFGESSDGGDDSVLVYMGEPYPRFCDVYNHYSFSGVEFGRVLPLTSKYVFHSSVNSTVYREIVRRRIGTDIDVFYTYLGDAMVDFGVFGMIIYSFLVVLITYGVLKRKNAAIVSLPYVFWFVILGRQVLLGLFAYVYTSIATSVFLIGTLFLNKYFNKRSLHG